ncbi:MAG: M23 family metallopeptidase [Tepidibacillus sp.]
MNYHDPYDRTTGNIMKGLANRLGKNTSRLAFNLGKKVIRSIGKLIISLLIKTAPVWIPVVILFALAYFSFVLVYAIPREAAEDAFSTNTDKVSAFYGFSKDKDFIAKNEDLFDRYKKIADKWDDNLTDQQKEQVKIHSLSWAILLSVDRLIHDPFIKDTNETEIEIDPEQVFTDLKPKFEWKKSIIRTEEKVEVECKNNKQQSNSSTKTEKCYDIKVHEQTVSLVTKAETIEGTFIYHYKTIIEDQNGKKVTREEVDYIEYPKEYFQPLFNYLANKGIKNESDIELVVELAQIYDEQYGINIALKKNLNIDAQPTITGQNEWVWVTLSTRVTSKYGLRSSGYHEGIDIGATNPGVDGDPIWAMTDGIVEYAGWARGYGQVIYLDHYNGLKTRYGHLSKVLVKNGQYVKKGDLIALMGNTGRSSGTHLHFEIRQEGTPYNPAFYFPILQ